MKMLRNLLLVVGLSISFGGFAQTCFGDFTSSTSGNTVHFSGTVSLNVTNIIWSFGDGNYDYSNSVGPNHTYTSPGTYQACIVVYDSLNSCSDSSCHMVFIDSCYGAFTYTMNGLTGSFSGYAIISSPNTVYVWNFGDASNGTGQNATHTYANAGTYTVCFAYYDLSTGCADSLCQQIYIGGCQADFTYIDSMGYVFFISNSTVGSSGTYMWDFGDGNYSTQQNPSNTYNAVGTYQVCLTTYDSMQNFCDSTCHYVTITNISGIKENLSSISGLTIAPNPSDENATISFQMNESGETLISVYDIAGRNVLSYGIEEFKAGKQSKQINTTGILSGTYIVQIISNGQVSNCKMIVAHKE